MLLSQPSYVAPARNILLCQLAQDLPRLPHVFPLGPVNEGDDWSIFSPDDCSDDVTDVTTLGTALIPTSLSDLRSGSRTSQSCNSASITNSSSSSSSKNVISAAGSSTRTQASQAWCWRAFCRSTVPWQVCVILVSHSGSVFNGQSFRSMCYNDNLPEGHNMAFCIWASLLSEFIVFFCCSLYIVHD